MYRRYENPYKLEKQLEALKEEYHVAVEENADDDYLMNLAYDIAELKDRINFAWQDDAEE